MGDHRKRFWVLFVLLLAFVPVVTFGEEKTKEQPLQYFQGKVVPLADLVKRVGSELDRDAEPHWLALVTEEGKIYPLIKDAGGRLFFKDKRLLNRPMRINGRMLPNSQMLQVIETQSVIKGRLHEIYYWCDICSIRRGENMLCDCCGAPMVLKEERLTK